MKRPKSWKPDKLYTLADYHPKMPSIGYAPTTKDGIAIKAIWSGEFREPKKREWYLSGCEGHELAYKAFGDLSTKYFIMKIVEVRIQTITTHEILENLDN